MSAIEETTSFGALLGRIEDLIATILDDMIDHRPLSVPIRSRQAAASAPTRLMNGWPGSTVEHAWRFSASPIRFSLIDVLLLHALAVLLRILELIHHCLLEDTIMTKRDLYYSDPTLFRSQAHVDKCVDDIASCLDVATAKGLAVGCFGILRSDGSYMDGRAEQQGTLIPTLRGSETVTVHVPKWILVIEKEASFRALVNSAFAQRICREGIVLTGRGYPDRATREFLRRLASLAPATPLLALADADPDGLAIVATYKHGSRALAHERAALATPRLAWLGVRTGDVAVLLRRERAAEGQPRRVESAMPRLTVRDRKMAVRLLGREACAEDGAEPEWRREVQVMLMLGYKAEIEILEHGSGGLSGWLEGKLAHC